MRRILIIGSLLLSLSACARHYGTPTIQDYGRYLTLQPGVSTKHDIYQRFGQPHDVLPTPTGSTWVYLAGNARLNGASFIPFVGIVAAGQTIESMQARITFDQYGSYVGVETKTARKYANSWVEIVHQVQPGGDPGQRVQGEMAHLHLPFDPEIAEDIKVFQKSSGVPGS